MGRFRKKMFGLNQGKKTTNTSTIPFELVDEEELSSIPSDVEAVLHALREATTVPSSTICVFFLSQVVAVLQNRAAVDHGLHKLENEGTILLIEIASMPALVFAEDWIKLVREQATSCNLGGIVMNRQNAIDIVGQANLFSPNNNTRLLVQSSSLSVSPRLSRLEYYITSLLKQSLLLYQG
eukprot:c17969_g1_i1.p1 GENE.c17969_g1_i1~~c17969_g1_i1.p1  ORF type:complete len:196 (+),score=41.65 c17969_g1_i1:47-589(+)